MLLRRISILGRRRPAVGAARLSTLFPTATPAEDKPVQRGVQFPSDELGRRSSTATGKAVLAAALRGACTEEGDRLAQLVEGEQTWRENYQQHFLALVRYAATRYNEISAYKHKWQILIDHAMFLALLVLS